MTGSVHGAIADYAFEEREHRELGPGLDRVHELAEATRTAATPDLAAAAVSVIDWIDEVLLPHAAWEEAWLYPEFDRRAGTPWATRTMAFEHRQIRELARRVVRDHERLAARRSRDDVGAMRDDLIAFEAVLRAHIEREEHFLLPLLMDDAIPGA